MFHSTNELSFILKPAGRKGVGVFVTHGVAKDVLLELFFDEKPPRLFPWMTLEDDKALREYALRYGVETEEGVWCSPNFSDMAIGWYLNHSSKPNAHHDADSNYFASRDIKAGEEITIDYRKL